MKMIRRLAVVAEDSAERSQFVVALVRELGWEAAEREWETLVSELLQVPQTNRELVRAEAAAITALAVTLKALGKWTENPPLTD